MTDKKREPQVDKDTAKGLGEGGHAPHPSTPEEFAPFDPHSYATPSDADDAKEPEQNERPIPTQKPKVSPGTGHESAKGGVPEKQPSTKRQ